MLSKKEIAWLRSLQVKKHRQEAGLFIAEGRKVCSELLRSRFDVRHVYVTAEGQQSFQPGGEHLQKVLEISGRDMEQISALSTPSDVFCVAEIPSFQWNLSLADQHIVPVLDEIADPGNLGTIIRLADWFGLPAILCSPRTVDAYNPKVVQASMGSLFRVRVFYEELETVFRANNEKSSVPVYGAVLDGESLYTTPLSSSGFVLFGNESQGVGKESAVFVTNRLTIPRASTNLDSAESLNVAVAAAIVCSEFHRRKK